MCISDPVVMRKQAIPSYMISVLKIQASIVCWIRKKGRIFTYDTDGNLLYLFGGIGNRLGNFRDPVALDVIDNNFVVLDFNMSQITVFEPTEYGRLVREAVELHLTGKYDESAAKWEQVLKFNANCELAYIGMGKALLRKDDFRQAMKYFRLGNKRDYYSKAFDLYRQGSYR